MPRIAPSAAPSMAVPLQSDADEPVTEQTEALPQPTRARTAVPAPTVSLVSTDPVAPTRATAPGVGAPVAAELGNVNQTVAGFAPLAADGALRAPAPIAPAPPSGSSRDTAPGVAPAPVLPLADDARGLANAISPGPAAQRREAPPPEPVDPASPGRRRSDDANAPRPIPSVSGRAGSTTSPPPPARASSTTNPPPLGHAGSTTNPPPPGRAGSTTNPPPLEAAGSTTNPPPLRASSTTNPPPLARAGSTTSPPPLRAGSTTSPPPLSGARTASPTSPPPLVTSLGSQPLPGAGPQPLAPSVPAPPPMTAAGAGLPRPGTASASTSTLAGPPASAPIPPANQPALPPTDYPRVPAGFARDFDTPPSAVAIVPTTDREPPPTRIHRPEALVDRPFTPPKVSQVPEVPEPGLLRSARYTVRFAKARWQRRGAIKLLGSDIKKDTDALDQVLGALGAAARSAEVDGRVFSGENAAITDAEARIAQLGREHNDVDTRKLEENAKFVEVERERNTKLGEAERMVDEAQKELAQLEGQRKTLRDTRKEHERRQKAYLKAAEDTEKQSGNATAPEQQADLRRAAEQHRREAAALEPERQELDRRLAAIERPIGEATARLDAAKAELDAAKRSLADAREGHTHRLAELDAEQKRKAREIAQTEAEVTRRLVTLGTLVNLNRVEDPRFTELYERIDRLRGAITARTAEIEKLTAERAAYDRGHVTRGLAAIGGAILVFIALIVILRAVLLR